VTVYHDLECLRKQGVLTISYVPGSTEVRFARWQYSKMRKRGPDRTPLWWWQYKTRPVAGLSQSVSGTYTFKVRVLEGVIRPRPSAVTWRRSLLGISRPSSSLDLLHPRIGVLFEHLILLPRPGSGERVRCYVATPPHPDRFPFIPSWTVAFRTSVEREWLRGKEVGDTLEAARGKTTTTKTRSRRGSCILCRGAWGPRWCCSW